MRGSIRKRGSTYTYWLDIGPDPVTGKRRRTKGGFRTKRECQVALNEAISALRSGSLVQPSRRTVASFLVEEWLPAVRMAGLRDSTWASYRMNVEKHLVPGLGAIELQRLSPAQLNAFYRELLTRGRRNAAGGLAPKTVYYIHSILHRALRDAVRWGYVVRNVANTADPPKAKTPEMRVWNPAQLRAFLDHVRAIGCMRRGCWPQRPGCAAGRFLACGGAIWTWTPAGWRCGVPEFWWTTRCRCRSRRRPRAAARLPWTRRR